MDSSEDKHWVSTRTTEYQLTPFLTTDALTVQTFSGKPLPSRSPHCSRAQRRDRSRHTLYFNIRPAEPASVVDQLYQRASEDTSFVRPVKPSVIIPQTTKDSPGHRRPFCQSTNLSKAHSIRFQPLKQQSLPQCFFHRLSIAATISQPTERSLLHIYISRRRIPRFRWIILPLIHAWKYRSNFDANPDIDSRP